MTWLVTTHDALNLLRRGRVVRRVDERGESLVFVRPDNRLHLKDQLPEDTPDLEPVAWKDCDAVTGPSARAGIYYVDPSHSAAGDWQKGTSYKEPWETLEPVRALLDERVYRGGVTIWIRTGTILRVSEDTLFDPDSEDSFLRIRAWGSATHPIQLAAYDLVQGSGPDYSFATPDAHTYGGPELDGEDPFVEADSGKEVFAGIFLDSTCHVQLLGVRISGFDDGVRIRDSQYILVDGCEVYENLDRGIAILPHATNSDVSRDVTVQRCHVRDNGWSTGGANIVLGSGVADCVLKNNDCYSSASMRGVDGITLDGCSSGHIIEGNHLYNHVFAFDDGSDGNGLDLKGVRQRHESDGAVTIVRDNHIHDNQGPGIVIHNGCLNIHVFRNRIWRNGTGIDIIPGNLESCDDITDIVYPYDASGDTFRGVEQGEIYIYRNVIGASHDDGVRIELGSKPIARLSSCTADTGEVTLFRDIFVVNNTIDYNGNYGVVISRAFTSDHDASDPLIDEQDAMMGAKGTIAADWNLRQVPRWFQRIGVYNNILARNGVRLQREGKVSAYSQLYLGDLIKTVAADTSGATESDFDQFFIDYNVYQMPRQAVAANFDMPIHFRFWLWDSTLGAMKIWSQQQILVSEFAVGLSSLPGETWAPADNPTDPQFSDVYPRGPDHHLLGNTATNIAIWGAVGTSLVPGTAIPSGFSVLHAEDMVPIAIGTDYDGARPSTVLFYSAIGAFNT